LHDESAWTDIIYHHVFALGSTLSDIAFIFFCPAHRTGWHLFLNDKLLVFKIRNNIIDLYQFNFTEIYHTATKSTREIKSQ
ncbi:MAG: hypothetical protein KAG53_06470, partial [Endozoicomonadaceae bacterium]|nr:hypothetical protein [Endozoicomonadaceae bacterium]